MVGEIIAIGDELTSGRILNTTSSFAAGHLFAAGHEIIAMSTVGDDPDLIKAALLKALARAEFIIVTGGLGATTDDMTNETVAEVLGRPTRFYPEVLDKLIGGGSGGEPGTSPPTQNVCLRGEANSKPDRPGVHLPRQGHPLEKLAWLPEGAIVLKPEAKMAGHMLIHENKPIFFLPGVPLEMKELMLECVIPYLAGGGTGRTNFVRQKVYKVFGLSETTINNKLKHLEENNPYVRIGYYPVFPEVHVSLTVMGDTDAEIRDLFNQFNVDIVALLAPYIYGKNDDTMEQVVGDYLMQHGKSLAVAESCSGGLISHLMTKVPGSSRYFLGGVVAYSNDMKRELLGVSEAVLKQHGAVSAETARAMAEGIGRVAGADVGVAVTGIAGPSGGTPDKPVGTVYFGLAIDGQARDFLYHFSGSRQQVQAMAAQTAIDLVRRSFLQEDDLDLRAKTS